MTRLEEIKILVEQALDTSVRRSHPQVFIFADPQNGHGNTYTIFKSNKWIDDREAYRLCYTEAALRTGKGFGCYVTALRPYGHDWQAIADLGMELPEFIQDLMKDQLKGRLINGISGNY